MKRLKYLIFAMCSFFVFSKVSLANNIKSITMDIYVDNNGDAHITEKWEASLNQGTEGYKPYYNLGTSEIKDYKVSLNNQDYETISYWNVDSSFDEKKYKAGINSIDNGYELCFGISEYGNNTYTLKYTITNFVSTTEDADVIYWQLIPYELSDKPEYVKVKIYSDFNYANDIPVWGYGNYGGYAYVAKDLGYIEVLNENGLNSDEYITVLVKFPKGTFNTSSILDKDFDDIYEMAEVGATHYKEKAINKIFKYLVYIFQVVINLGIVAAVVYAAAKSSKKFGTKNIKFSKEVKNVKDAPYFREIPCNKDIFKAYWISCHYGLIKNKNDFLGAIMLKWLKNGNISNTTVTTKILKKEERAINLLNTDGMSAYEITLFNMMTSASKDGILESNEFKNWCKSHYKKILDWFTDVIDYETEKLVEEGLITQEKKKFSTVYNVNEMMREPAMQMAGLKKFLNEFSNIQDRESIEVKLWEEYLMYAQIFGIAKKVAKEFKKLYPDVITDEYYNDVIFIHTISYDGVNAATSARAMAESYSAGGGGFSSGGGGGGSFGGGGGGGGFR